MRKFVTLTAAAVALAIAAPAVAELQTVTVDGSLQIRGNYYSNHAVSAGFGTSVNPGFGGVFFAPGIRWPGFFLPARPIGSLAAQGFGQNTIASAFSWDNRSNSHSFVEQRTRLGVMADFTNEVTAYIELDSYNIWGDDFRSNYITGADFSRINNSDVQLYQAYVEAREMFGYPLTLKVGRQELSYGSEWLIGTNDTSAYFTGLSFDAVKLRYATDMFSVDLFAAKLAENSPNEEDGDVDFYGLYASYLGLEDITIDLYGLWLRDARAINDTNFMWFVEALEDIFGVDDYDVTNIYTIGLRGAGTFGAFDFEAEFAYQWGDVGQIGSTFRPFGLYGDDNLKISEWAGNLEVGYTFDMQMTPRVFLGAAYFGGEENRDITFWQWLSPFDRPKGSASFNRLFSNWEYTEFFANTDESNMWIGRGGVSFSPTETVDVLFTVSYYETLEAFDAPRYFKLGRYRVPIAPALSFWTQQNDDSLGWELGLYVTYNYSEDLSFEAGWAHLFTKSGLTDGNFSVGNGLLFTGGSSTKDADYLYLQTKIAF